MIMDHVKSFEDAQQQCMKSASQLEMAVCHFLRSLTPLYKAMKQRHHSYGLEIYRKGTTEKQIKGILSSLVELQRLLLKKVRLYSEYFSENSLVMQMDTHALCRCMLQDAVNELKSESFSLPQRSYRIINELANYYRMKEIELESNLMIPPASLPPPWLSIQVKQHYKNNKINQ